MGGWAGGRVTGWLGGWSDSGDDRRADCAQVALLWAWANGRLAIPTIDNDAWWTHVPTILWIISMP